jgi:hypothetical protein
MKTAKFVLIMVVGAILGFLIYLAMKEIQRMPIIGIVLVAIVGVVALLGLCYVAYFFLNKINSHYHHMESRKLARQAELKRLEYDQFQIDQAARAEQTRWEREQMRWEREQARQDQAQRDQAELERRKLELEEQRIKLQAYQAQAVHVGRDQALIIRDYSGLQSRTAYEPASRIVREEYQDTELVADPAIEQIDAPRIKVRALDLLQDHELDGANDVVLGVNAQGDIVHRTWEKVLAVLVLGLMGGGKTNTLLWLLLQLFNKGYKVALIDAHARSDESTHARLKPFAASYDTPVGDSAIAAMRVVKHVKSVFLNRRDNGAHVDYNLVFAIDEFTGLMSTMKDDTDEWQDVAIALVNLLKKLVAEGRKYGVFVVAAGQASNASATGGTDIRDLFPTRITHAMRAKQAQMLGLTEQKHAIQKLETGQVYIDMAVKDDPFFAVVPEVTEEFTRAVLGRMTPRKTSPKLVLPETFNPVSVWVPENEQDRSRKASEITMNAVPHTPQPTSEELPEMAKRVLDLRLANTSKAAIILEVWNVRPGGSAAYKNAVSEYTQIIENLETLGYLVAQK